MKKALLIGLIMAASVFCTGCVKVSYDIDINNKDQVTITETKAIKNELLNTNNPDFEKNFAASFEDSAQQYRAKGYEVKEFRDEDYRGLSIIKKDVGFTNVISAMPDGFDKENKNNYFKREVGLIHTTYKICMLPELNKAMRLQSGGNSSQGLYKASEGSPYADLTIKIPYKATKHNADMVFNDKVYKWDLTKKDQPVIVLLEYKKLDLSIVAGILSLILIIGGALYVAQKNNKSDVVKGL